MMVKILVCGDVSEEASSIALTERVNQLQQSTAGPFHLLFVLSSLDNQISVGIPAYGHSNLSLSTESFTTFNNECGITTISGLTIAYCFNKNFNQSDEGYKSILHATSSPSYRGCDIFLSSDWPFDMHQFLSQSDYETFLSLQIGLGNGSRIISNLVNILKPRYHFASGIDIFYARPPYSNSHSLNTIPHTRFISLAKVSNSNNKDKNKKWLHALSLEPIISMSPQDIVLSNTNTVIYTDNPYMTTILASNNQHPNKKMKFNEITLESNTKSNNVFFGQNISKSSSSIIPTSTSTTLFIAGFPPRCKDEEIKSLFINEGLLTMNRQEGKSYAFLTFTNHTSAMNVINTADTFTYHGRSLIINWAKGLPSNDNSNNIISPPSTDHKLVFFGGVPHIATTEDILKSMQLIIPEKDVISVRRPEGKTFLFIEFSSYGLASKVIDMCAKGLKVFNTNVFVGWGKTNGPESETNECWFCLSSTTIKTHLIISVADEAYLAIPRGGMHEYHVMIVPIACVSSRLQLNKAAVTDIDKYATAVAKMLSTKSLTFINFERCVKNNRGKDHLQFHIIPIPLTKASEAVNIFNRFAMQYNLEFNEFHDEDETVSEVLQMDSESRSSSSGQSMQYVYIDLPYVDDEGVLLRKRFCFIDHEGRRVPLQFGLEVSANVLGDPSKAQWKNCVVEAEEEQRLADQFRDGFADLDFTLA